MVSNNDLVEYLTNLGACDKAVAWVKTNGGDLNKVWNECPRGDWMWWLLSRTDDVSIEESIKFANYCAANTVAHVEGSTDVKIHKAAAYCTAAAKDLAAIATKLHDKRSACFAAYIVANATVDIAISVRDPNINIGNMEALDMSNAAINERQKQADWIRDNIKDIFHRLPNYVKKETYKG